MPELRTLLEREMQEIRPAGYTIDDVASRREQRRRNQRIGTAVVALVIAAAAIAGVVQAFEDVRSPEGPGGQPSTTSSGPSASPSVRVLAPSGCPDFSCSGPLEPGRYRATYYNRRRRPARAQGPAITFEISSPGWTWSYSGNFAIVAEDSKAEGFYDSDGMYFLLDPAIASQDCTDSAERGVGRSVDDLVTWLEAAPGLAVSEPTPVTVGGLDGFQLDIALDSAWTQPCSWSEGLPAVPLVFSGAEIGGYNWTMVQGQSMRWYILDSADGVLIVDIEDNPGGRSQNDLFRTGSEIVDSMVFSPPS
jgi:hypothetical protein